ncbi:MAG: type II toxin-antitoxin system Phd/YefM family antitoxin [Candidatus Marinimicrobia bacterium]|nr:type II toxin-antitoxin system Phd/YefM family antitoxin [Candidatus Neomarinimicrobiota bacterium]
MKSIDIAHDIIPVGEFKTNISRWLRRLRENQHPVIITQNGRPAGVLITPEEYDRLAYLQAFLASVQQGIAEADAGKIFSTDEVKEKLAEYRKSR